MCAARARAGNSVAARVKKATAGSSALPPRFSTLFAARFTAVMVVVAAWAVVAVVRIVFARLRARCRADCAPHAPTRSVACPLRGARARTRARASAAGAVRARAVRSVRSGGYAARVCAKPLGGVRRSGSEQVIYAARAHTRAMRW